MRQNLSLSLFQVKVSEIVCHYSNLSHRSAVFELLQLMGGNRLTT